MIRGVAGLGLLAALLAGGCERAGPAPVSAPASAPATRPAPAPPPPPPAVLAAGLDGWDRAESLARLADPDAGEDVRRSAAVRLVRLAGGRPLCVPAELPDGFAVRLRVLSLDEAGYALGLDLGDEDRLGAPVLIASDGRVTRPCGGIEEESTVLYRSTRPTAFPHIVASALRLWVIRAEGLATALALRRAAPVRFAGHDRDGYLLAVLRMEPGLGGAIVGAYDWDIFEEAFLGPQRDVLGDPPGGHFELDLGDSPLLVPVGGELPPPPAPVEEPVLPVEPEFEPA